MSERIIEKYLPIAEINMANVREKTLVRTRFRTAPLVPRISNLHWWAARRPASGARVLTLASVLPSSTDINALFSASSLDLLARGKSPDETLYALSPKLGVVEKAVREGMGRQLADIVVLDPMAGGGSIPLESIRLGFRTIAIEYNPVAYLILKATVEFPAKYAGAGLFEETLKAAKWFIAKAREELSKYYGENAENYIFARGVRCPFCRGLIPVQGVAPEITKASRFKSRYLRIEFDKEKKIFTIETTDTKSGKPFEKRGNNIKCPYCGKWFQLRGRAKAGQTAFDRWFQEHARLMKSVVEELEQVTPEMEDKLLELHIPLVKQVGNTFVAIWDDEDERGRFIQAFRDLSNEILELQDYIPIDEIPAENKWVSTARNKSLTHWYMLFNPRQLLAIAKLSKLVAEIAEQQASKDGEFGAAVALYLAFAIDKMVDYNTIATHWQGTGFKTGIAHTLRGESTLDFRQEYCEMVVTLPERSLEWALEPHIAGGGKLTKTAGGILPVLKFLCDEFRNVNLGDRVTVCLGDATRLSEILDVSTVDVVNVDPPYFEQVIYSDRSEFFWVILRRSLAPVLELLFKPGLKLPGWSWTSSKVPREREVVTYDKRDSSGRFRRFFKEFVRETYKVLKDDGVLVLWFTHPTDVAWRTVGESLYDAGYVVSKVWPLQTEMKTRYKRQVNVIAQETSLIIVARKYDRKRLVEVGADVRRSLLNHPRFVEVAREVVEEARKVSREAGVSPADMMALMLGSALSVATRFEIPGLVKFDDLFDAAATKVDELFISPLIRKVLMDAGPVKLSPSDVDRVVECVRRAMLRDAAARSYVTLWFLSRVDLETGRYRDEPLPLSYDFAQTVTKLLGYDIDRLREMGLIGESIATEAESEEEEGRRRGKAYYPLMFEALSAARARVTWSRISSLVPGRALYLAYLSLNETGAPSVRADSIRRRLSTWSSDDVAEAASLAVILLETARDIDLGFKQARYEGLEAFLHG
ncbi:MAG: hypothetical protein DRN04_10840, partial [Thermoprotei archaeon]